MLLSLMYAMQREGEPWRFAQARVIQLGMGFSSFFTLVTLTLKD